MRNYYDIIPKDGYYLIQEKYTENSGLTIGLVSGQEKAMLFDSGMGVFGTELREIVERLTDLPVVCVVSHGHPDHIGGAVLFDEVYMNSRDEGQLGRLAPEGRLRDVGMFSRKDQEVMDYAAAHVLDCSGFTYRNIDGGDEVDLGGVTFEILCLRGHSKGSIAAFNRKDGYCFSGDAFSPHLPASSVRNPQEFQDMADDMEAFLAAVPPETTIYSGHMLEPVKRSRIEELKTAAAELAAGKTAGDKDIFMPISPVKNQKEHVCGSISITYDPLIYYKSPVLSGRVNGRTRAHRHTDTRDANPYKQEAR